MNQHNRKGAQTEKQSFTKECSTTQNKTDLITYDY